MTSRLAVEVALDAIEQADCLDMKHGDVLVDPTFVPYDGIAVIDNVIRVARGGRYTAVLICLDGSGVSYATISLLPSVYVARLRDVTLDPQLHDHQDEQHLALDLYDAVNERSAT